MPTMDDRVNRQLVLVDRPKGPLAETDFAYRETEIPEPGPGEALTRTLYISVDPANRAWMSPVRTYVDPVEVGGVMGAFTLAQVVRSNVPGLQPGDLVEAMNGWQDYRALPGRVLQKVAPRRPLSMILSGLGVTAKTAYFGLLEVGRPQAGETVVVSAAAGATGSVAGQIARIVGCRVVGLAGSEAKCRYVVDEL